MPPSWHAREVSQLGRLHNSLYGIDIENLEGKEEEQTTWLSLGGSRIEAHSSAQLLRLDEAASRASPSAGPDRADIEDASLPNRAATPSVPFTESFSQRVSPPHFLLSHYVLHAEIQQPPGRGSKSKRYVYIWHCVSCPARAL